MSDRQCGLPSASSVQPGCALGHVRTLVSVIERSRITIDHPSSNRDRKADFTHYFDGVTDVDTAVLEWIVSYVPSRRRSKAC
jgi:hypothetical protein